MFRDTVDDCRGRIRVACKIFIYGMIIEETRLHTLMEVIASL